MGFILRNCRNGPSSCLLLLFCLTYIWYSQPLHPSLQSLWPVHGPLKPSTRVHQGSVLGPLPFIIYTPWLGPIMHSHGLSKHCYTEDIQPYPSIPQSLGQDLRLSLGHIFMDAGAQPPGFLSDCCKTDFFWSCSLDLRLVPLCIIQQNWLFLTQLATQLLLQTTVISCIHYCNALPTGDPMCVMKPLQMVHSVVVHLISRPTSPHCWSSSTGYRKSLMLAFRVLAGSTPSWLNNLLRALLPLICWVPQMSTVWNPNYFPTLFPNRGTTSRALSELRQPCLPSSFLFRDISSKSTISPHLLSPLLLYPPSLPLYSSTLLVASGTCTM